MKKYFGNISLIIISISLMLAVLEFSTRLFLKREARSFYEHRILQPEPYQDSDYFSKAFINESIYEQPGRWINPEGTRIIYPSNYQGKYFNVENNLRYTTDPPDKFANYIHLFGGSTIYNAEVPDQHTVASYIQRVVNQKMPKQYRVLNYGATSINTAQQLERLEGIELKAGDIVIFYGGVNDAWLFTTGRINGWILGERLMTYKSDNLNIAQRIQMKLYRKLHKKSHFVESFFNPFNYQIPEHMKDSTRIKEMKRELATSYNNSMLNANLFCRKKGASFYNFLQPTILTRANRTAYEEEVLQNKFLSPDSWLMALEYSYEVLTKVNDQLQRDGICSKNLTTLLNQSKDSHYLDFCHFTEKGNELVASAICKSIFAKDSK